MKKLIIVLLFIGAVSSVEGQNAAPLKFNPPPNEVNMFKYWRFWAFPTTDSLRAFNNKWITNNAAAAFTNLRLHYLLEGIIDFLDQALEGGGGSGNFGIDSLRMQNDSVLVYRKNGVFRSMGIRGKNWNLQQVLNNGAVLTENETITVLDSLIITSGKVILDSLRLDAVQTVTTVDTTLWKMAMFDGSGNFARAPSWFSIGANMANTNLKATGNRLHNWDHKNLFVDSIGQLRFESIENDAVLPRKNKMSLTMLRSAFSNFNVGGPFFNFALRKADNSADSIINSYGYTNKGINVLSVHAKTAATMSAQIVANSIDSGKISLAVTESSISSEIAVDKHNISVTPNDTLFMKARPAATLDSALGMIRVNGKDMIVKVPSTVIGGATVGAEGVSLENDSLKLGQDVSASGNPAALLSDREIPLNGFGLRLKGLAAQTKPFITFHRPDNGAYKIWEGTSSQSFGKYSLTLDESYLNPDGQRDFVLHQGYNINGVGGRENMSEGAMHDAWESHFDPGSGMEQFERFLQVTLPTGEVMRPWGVDIRKSAPLYALHAFRGEGFTFLNSDNTRSLLNFSNNGSYVFQGVAGNTFIRLNNLSEGLTVTAQAESAGLQFTNSGSYYSFDKNVIFANNANSATTVATFLNNSTGSSSENGFEFWNSNTSTYPARVAFTGGNHTVPNRWYVHNFHPSGEIGLAIGGAYKLFLTPTVARIDVLAGSGTRMVVADASGNLATQSIEAQYNTVTTVTTTSTVGTNTHWIRVDASLGNITLTLPAASSVFTGSKGINYKFKRVDSSGNTVTVQRAGSDTIDGVGTSFTLVGVNDFQAIQCTSTSAWELEN